MKQNLRYSLLMLLLAVFNLGVFADNSFTFEQTSKTAGTLTGAPDGVSYTFVNTGTNANDQLTANKSMTLTISGLTPTYTLTGLTLELRNNASKGDGNVTVTQGDAVLGSYQVTGLGNTYQEIDIDITPTSDEGDIVVLIEATENSVYCDKFTFFYSNGKTDIATLNSISPTQLEVNDEGAFTLDATFAEGTVAGEDYEVSWSSGNEDVLMVDATTGEFMAIDAGTVDVTVLVTVLDDETYNEVSKTFTVTVTTPMTFETVTLPYEESFAGTFGKFQSDGVKAGTTDVWTAGSAYAKGTAYISGTRYPCTSYLYSPILDLSNETTATLTFSHVGRYFGTPADEAKLVVRQKDGDLWGEWEPLTIENFTNSSSWTFTDATIDLSAYAGQQVQLAFVYICPSTSTAGTWEIKDLAVTNVVQKIDIATLNGITPTNVEIGDFGEFTLDATFAEGTVADEDYEISWTSSDPTILEVAGNMYEAKATGTVEVTVSVTVLDDTKYNEVSETFTVTVKEPFVAATYELVTDANTLADGDNIIIAYVNTADKVYYAMGGQADNNRLATGDVTYNTDGTLTIGEGVQQITLEGAAGGYYFYVGNGYLYAASSDKNHMKTQTEADDNAKATIEIAENGDATIIFQGEYTRNHLRFNKNGNNPIFSCYAETSSVKTLPQIYRLKSDVETVTITIGEHGYASYCGDKDLDFSATELKAYAVTQVENGVMILTEFEDGYKAGEGAVLKGAEGEYQVPVATTATAVAGNMLIGNNSDAAIPVDADGTTYRFGYSPAAQKVGFMKATSNFTVASGKAYLKINSTNNAPAFLSFDGTATGIDAANVSTTAADGQRYNLNGQRVNSSYRGVVIVDGKKLIQK